MEKIKQTTERSETKRKKSERHLSWMLLHVCALLLDLRCSDPAFKIYYHSIYIFIRAVALSLSACHCHILYVYSILSIVPFIILHTQLKIMIIYLIYCQNNRNLLVFLGVVFEMEVDRSRSHSLGVCVCVFLAHCSFFPCSIECMSHADTEIN